MAKVGGKPPRPPRPRAIKVAAPPNADSPVLRDIVTRLKNQQRMQAQADQARARAQAVGSVSARTPRGRRPTLPPVEEMFNGPTGSGAYDEVLLGGSGEEQGGSESFDDTAEEQRARAADITRYVSPAPTICPPRPRSLEYKYDPARQVLTVTFRDGGTYEYSQVDRRTFYNMTRVKSTGRYIDRRIKGFFPYTKVGA